MNHQDNEKIITLKSYNDSFEAGAAKIKLEENGIESFVEDTNTVGMNPLGGVELKVFEKDIKGALEILALA